MKNLCWLFFCLVQMKPLNTEAVIMFQRHRITDDSCNYLLIQQWLCGESIMLNLDMIAALKMTLIWFEMSRWASFTVVSLLRFEFFMLCCVFVNREGIFFFCVFVETFKKVKFLFFSFGVRLMGPQVNGESVHSAGLEYHDTKCQPAAAHVRRRMGWWYAASGPVFANRVDSTWADAVCYWWWVREETATISQENSLAAVRWKKTHMVRKKRELMSKQL